MNGKAKGKKGASASEFTGEEGGGETRGDKASEQWDWYGDGEETGGLGM